METRKNKIPTHSPGQGGKQKNSRGVEFSGRKKAFTLVELIIVITILAILATLAFMSFQGYSSQSRDSNRMTTVKNIEKGVNIFITKTGKVPDPDNLIGTGELNSVPLNYVGKVGEGIARAINLNEVPMDPRASEQYWYGVDLWKRYFQVGLTLESETAYRPGILPSYAGNIHEAKVQGNYQYPLNYQGMVYSLPSLLFLGSGTLTNTSAFIVDTGNNVPYTFGGQATGSQNVAEVLNIVVGTGGLSLTGIGIPSMTSSDYKSLTGIPEVFSGVALAMGITDKTKLGVVVYGGKYSQDVNLSSGGNNASNTPKNGKGTAGNPGKNCKDVLDTGGSTGDGKYRIELNTGSGAFEAYCDMSGGGWTRILLYNGSNSNNYQGFRDCKSNNHYNGIYFECINPNVFTTIKFTNSGKVDVTVAPSFLKWNDTCNQTAGCRTGWSYDVTTSFAYTMREYYGKARREDSYATSKQSDIIVWGK